MKMKYIILAFLFLASTNEIYTQEIIATSKHPFATANHNQRKIIRDSDSNIYVAYTDSLSNSIIINGVYYNSASQAWSNPEPIAEGTNPTLAINRNNRTYLLYQSNDSMSQIRCQYTENFTEWSESTVLSDTNYSCFLPVSDCDSSGSLNVFWVQDNADGTDSLQYGQVMGEELIASRSIAMKGSIEDIAIANHLMYTNNDVYFAYQSDDDSIVFCSSGDYVQSLDTVNVSIGSQPGLTFNCQTDWPGDKGNHIRMLFLDNTYNLIENEYIDYGGGGFRDDILQLGQIDYFCIDDLMPPLGYSYLFIRNDSLFHGFSFGSGWGANLQDTIATNPIYPSMAYKHFSSEYIDFVWMQESGKDFTIHYRRDDKYEYIYKGIDKELGKGFKITGYPNPFGEVLNIQVEVPNNDQIPSIDIYNTNSRLVASLHPGLISGNEYHFAWKTSESAEQIPPGLYFVRCTVGKGRTAKKVIKSH